VLFVQLKDLSPKTSCNYHCKCLDLSLNTAGEESIQPLNISNIEQLLSATKLKEWVLAFVENLDLVRKL
jgi:hypothetical protein